jgi:hypothetical protein
MIRFRQNTGDRGRFYERFDVFDKTVTRVDIDTGVFIADLAHEVPHLLVIGEL